MIKVLLGSEDNAVLLTFVEIKVGELSYSALHDGILRPHLEVSINDNLVTAENDGLKIEDIITTSPGLVLIQRKWTVWKPGKWQFRFNFNLEKHDYANLIIPSVMYHDNVHGEGKFPRGGVEASWSFREDRMPIPSCAILHDESNYCCLFTEPARGEADISSICAYKDSDGPACEIRVPFSEEPFSYCEKGILLGGQRRARQRYFHITRKDIPFVYERKFYIRAGTYAGNIFRIFTGLTDDAFAAERDLKQTVSEWGRIASLKLHHLIFLTVDDKKSGICGVQQGKGNPWYVQHAHENVCSSFLSRDMEAAYIYARAGVELGNNKMLDLAERIGRFFLRGALDNGLHQDFYKYSEKKMSGYHMPFDATTEEMREGANARSNGETMVNYLRLHNTLKNAGREIPEFVDMVKRNADFYISHQLTGSQSGSFGRWWSREGKPINTNGTNGAHIIPMLVELEKITGKSAEIDLALEKAADYYGSLISRNEYYGDTLDADCTDKEAGIVLLRAFLDLYERNGDKRYLELAKDAASFVLSWTWTYDVPFKVNTPMGKNKFMTKGMTAVSVAHHHLDFYGLYPAYDFLRIWEATGEEVWKNHALIMMNCCAQLVSSPGNLLDRSKKFIGYQPEKMNQTDWNYLLLELGGKGAWDTCVAWVVVLTLGAMLDIRARFPGILNFSFDENLLRQLDPSVF